MALKQRLINAGTDYKFGINTAPAFLNAESASTEFKNEEYPLEDSYGNVIAMAITKNLEKMIKYDGFVKGPLPEAGSVVSVIDPATGQSVTGIIGADVSYTEGRKEWAKASFSVAIYPEMSVTASDIHGYLGTFDANTNTPTLADTDTGLLVDDMYYVTVDGSPDFGGGAIALVAGDIVTWSGSAWIKQV